LELKGVGLQAKKSKYLRILRFRISRRRLTRGLLFAGNLLLLVIVISFIATTPRNSIEAQMIMPSTKDINVVNPLDQLASASVALTVSRLDNLPETTAIMNQAESEQTLLSFSPAMNNVIAKPQVVATKYVSNKDIKTYVVQKGDTIASIAQKFGISTNSILWSNNITGNTITPGVKLLIPPISGIVYTVKAGDTPASLATKFQANENLIIAYNDAEIKGIYPGERIIIPNGTEPDVVSNADLAAATYGWGYQATYGYNGYDPGNCTWWVAQKRIEAGDPLPTDLGNADTWAIRAQEFGIPVGSTPSVGAVVVMPPNNYSVYGHVAYVTAVHPNGTITISEMDFYGLGISDTRTISSAGYSYIY